MSRQDRRKSMREILQDAVITSVGGALIAGIGCWALMQWVPVVNNSVYIPNDTLIISTGPVPTS